MSVDPSSYDETLPERATVRVERSWANPISGTYPARAGDTIEVLCPSMTDGNCRYPDSGYRNDASEHVLRVLLTEDPRALSEFGKDEIVAWRHVGTVVSDA